MVFSRRERGAAAVEFALVAPLLVVLVWGIISYGYMLSFRQALSQGAAEGARSAAVQATAYDASQQTARTTAAKDSLDEAMASYGVSCSGGATCAVAYVPCGSNTCVSVTVTYPYGAHPLIPSIPMVPLPASLAYTATVRVS
ncbi:TadE/TadG family type IV pilus assembly protein [Nocardioides acrostichi]|uniref:Pilus assembly protein n=1 Tax=Nocardioides acrostichi TaxID=2784339 RepID=A0A930Y4Q8_9ACTN|nr:TadE/TadG family type IV pilus assembly protein [Nocardioides acrostichi]MBF4160460.1 pilus assembly protein [Nocardioides acrostichi]